MKILSKILCGGLLFLSLNGNLIAQTSKIRSVQLPEPSQIRNDKGGLLGGASDVGTIYYGITPAGSASKPVLLFIHGYNSNAKTWWENNEMYKLASNAGYRTAFVSVNPDKSYYVNGEMFREMTKNVCQKFGVNKVNIIAHSKGGLDSDAMAVLYNGKDYVQRIISLGSPHFGTPLSDLAQSGWVSWLTTPIGQNNAGTQSLQTGAVANFRNQISASPNYNLVNYRTFGAYGYSGVLWVSGVYLSWNGGGSSNGGNDGVVNYSSTKRPNAAVIFGTNDSRANLNHFEIADGVKMWNHIKNQLTTTAARGNVGEEITPENYNPSATTVSSSHIVSADGGSAKFDAGTLSKKIRIEVYQKENTPITLTHRNTQTQYNNWETANINTDGVFNSNVKVMRVDNMTASNYELSSEKPFVAIIYDEDGISATLTTDLNDTKLVYNADETMNFGISFNKNNINAQATGMLTRVSDLEGNTTTKTIVERIVFDQNLKAQVKSPLPAGIYNLTVEVKGNDFAKSMVTSIAIVGENAPTLAQVSEPETLAYPNPATERVTFRFELKEQGQSGIRVYDHTGKAVFQQDLSKLGKGNHEITWELNNQVKNGLYFYEISNNNNKVTKKLVIKN